MVTFLSSLTIVGTSVNRTNVVTINIGLEVIGVCVTELVLTNHGNGSTSDASLTVLLVDVTIHIATTRNLHVHRI